MCCSILMTTPDLVALENTDEYMSFMAVWMYGGINSTSVTPVRAGRRSVSLGHRHTAAARPHRHTLTQWHMLTAA